MTTKPNCGALMTRFDVFPSAVVRKLSSKTENYAAVPTVGVSTQAKSGNIEPTLLYPVALIMIKGETSCGGAGHSGPQGVGKSKKILKV